jgi:hypothetical protein
MNIGNNIFIDPGSKFSPAIGKTCSYSLLENNSNKSTTIYHYCYLNGETNAKVRIRKENGEDIYAVSNRKLGTINKVTWKVKITDKNKKILDTHIFELV